MSLSAVLDGDSSVRRGDDDADAEDTKRQLIGQKQQQQPPPLLHLLERTVRVHGPATLTPTLMLLLLLHTETEQKRCYTGRCV